VHDSTSVGGGVETFLKKIKIKIFFILFILFFLETFQSPLPHGGAVVHNGSSVGAGGLK
jgi:hypothetical protein